MSNILGALADAPSGARVQENISISVEAAVEAVRTAILVRSGESITAELADERARNIVQALVGLRVGDDIG